MSWTWEWSLTETKGAIWKEQQVDEGLGRVEAHGLWTFHNQGLFLEEIVYHCVLRLERKK